MFKIVFSTIKKIKKCNKKFQLHSVSESRGRGSEHYGQTKDKKNSCV